MKTSRSAEDSVLQTEVARLQARIAELEAAEQEKRAAEEALRELNANLQALIENTDDFILLSDRQARPVVFNSAYARVMKQLLDLDMRPGIKPHTLLTDPEEIAFWEDCHRRVLAGERFSVEYKVPVFEDGPAFWLEVRYNPVVKDGEVVGFSEFSRDITERKLEQFEQRERQDALEAEVARRTAETVELERQVLQTQKLESLGVLAGGIAHDFNNLLMAIVGHADLALLELPQSSPVRGDLREILNTARQASELTNQMLAYAGKGTASVRPLDLNKLIGEMEDLLSRSVSKKSRLSFSLVEGLPSVEADAAQLRQIVLNLVTNASEAIGQAPGKIRVVTRRSTLSAERAQALSGLEPVTAGEVVVLEVSDDGPGIAPEVLARIFEPFFTTKFTGRGLGLAAVQGIVRSAHGAVEVDGQPGQGSTFRIFLPARPAASVAPTAPECVTSAAECWQGQGVVLLVDDESAVRDVARTMLQRFGLSVLIARDGAEAVELMRARSAEIDCVLLDLLMPTMDGEETLAELRRIQPDVPVVLSSGYDEDAASGRFSSLDLAGFIQKPYTLRELQDVMREILEPSGANA